MKFHFLKNKNIKLHIVVILLSFFYQQHIYAQENAGYAVKQQKLQNICANSKLLMCDHNINGDLQCIKSAIKCDVGYDVLSKYLMYVILNIYPDKYIKEIKDISERNEVIERNNMVLAVMDLLLAKNINPRVKDDRGTTAIDILMFKKKHDLVSKLLKKGAMPGKNQLRIFYNLSLFLNKYSENRSKEFIDMLNEANGHCYGLSETWLYSKWASDNDQKNCNHEWFSNTIDKIIKWDGESALDNDTVEQFNRFLSIVTVFQDPLYYGLKIPYSDFKSTLKENQLYPESKKLTIESTLSLNFTRCQLEVALGMNVQNKKLVIINSLDHTVALYKKDDKYYYYDPNASEGEINSESISAIVEKIFESYELSDNESYLHLPFGIVIYDFKSVKIIMIIIIYTAKRGAI